MCLQKILGTVVATALGWTCCSTFADDAVYSVRIDTAPLIGQAAGPFSLMIALTNGSGLADGKSTATLSSVNFGGGSGSNATILVGGASGSLESGVTLTTSEFLSVFSEAFVPGRALSFTLKLATQVGGRPLFAPDRVSIYILDGTGTPLATKSPAANYLLAVDFFPEEARPSVYGTDPSRPPFTGTPIVIPAPSVDS